MAKRSPKNLMPGQVAHLDRGLFVRRNKTGTLTYGISYVFHGTLIREMIGPHLTLARQVLQTRKSEISRDKFQIPKKRRPPTFAAVCDRYMEHAKKSKRSWKRDEDTLKVARAFFRKKQIDEISAWDIERLKAARAETVTKSTVNRDTAVLKRLFNLAVDWGLLDKNPLKKVALYRIEEKLMRVLTDEEERRLIEASAPHFKPLVVVAINTGMRRSELLGLLWEQVDLRTGTITVKHSKSGRVRHVPINKTAHEALEGIPGLHDGHVFRYRGLPVQDVKTAFLKAVKRAGIPRCRFHDLRHTFATRLVLAGVDLATVKELMGHASISTTMRYAHPSPPHKREAVAKLDLPQPIHTTLDVAAPSK